MRQNQCIALLILSVVIWVVFINYFLVPNGREESDQKKLVEKLNELESAVAEYSVDRENLLQDIRSAIENEKPQQPDMQEETKVVEDTSLPLSNLQIPHTDDAVAVLLISCNRVTVSRCLDQLTRFRPSPQRFPVIVSQDCIHEKTSKVIDLYKDQVYHVHQPDQSDIVVAPKEKKFKGYFKIARHYKWALNLTFNHFNFSNVILIEDDLDISPDFFEYFAATLPILRADESLWCVSAWNDNGKEEFVDKNATGLLYRSDFFPGLGWMLTKSLWNELLPKWPSSYWDDWMREPEQRRGRSCIRPELSRTHTFGKIGVSNGLFYDKHLKYIYLNNEFYPFGKHDLTYLMKQTYDIDFQNTVYSTPIVSLQELKENQVMPKGAVRILYENARMLKRITKIIGLMDDLKSGVPRTGYLGIISFTYRNRRVFITPSSRFVGYDQL